MSRFRNIAASPTPPKDRIKPELRMRSGETRPSGTHSSIVLGVRRAIHRGDDRLRWILGREKDASE